MHATRMLMLNPDLDSVHAYTGGQVYIANSSIPGRNRWKLMGQVSGQR